MGESKKIFECVVSDIDGIEGSFHYYATESEIACEDFNGKVYGIRIENELNGTIKDYIEIIDVTSLYEKIIALTDLMARNKVTPISIYDVVYDFIG